MDKNECHLGKEVIPKINRRYTILLENIVYRRHNKEKYDVKIVLWNQR
jgi:hypothetical protein